MALFAFLALAGVLQLPLSTYATRSKVATISAIFMGMPMKMAEIVATFERVAYVERGSCNTPANARKAKRAIKKAFEYQMQGLGTTFIEVASNCPSNWKMTPEESLKWLD